MGDRLKDKVALVTGAGSIGSGWGNGKASAVLYAREGARILAADLNIDAAEETRAIIEEEGGTCTAFQADVSIAAEVAAMVQAGLDAYGRVDVLHNNVGIPQVGGPEEIAEDEWDQLFAVDVKSMYLTCRDCLPHMVAQGQGAIASRTRSPSRWAVCRIKFQWICFIRNCGVAEIARSLRLNMFGSEDRAS